MGAVLVAALLAQGTPDLFGGDDEVPPPEPVKPRPDETPLVIPPPDGPVPPGVPVPQEVPPAAVVRRTPDETRELLIAERLELQRTMPTYVIPTVVTVAGGLAFVGGGVVAFTSFPAATGFGGRRGDATPFYVGLPLALVGLGAFVFGLMWERERSLDREPFLDRIEQIEKELGW